MNVLKCRICPIMFDSCIWYDMAGSSVPRGFWNLPLEIFSLDSFAALTRPHIVDPRHLSFSRIWNDLPRFTAPRRDGPFFYSFFLTTKSESRVCFVVPTQIKITRSRWIVISQETSHCGLKRINIYNSEVFSYFKFSLIHRNER